MGKCSQLFVFACLLCVCVCVVGVFRAPPPDPPPPDRPKFCSFFPSPATVFILFSLSESREVQTSNNHNNHNHNNAKPRTSGPRRAGPLSQAGFRVCVFWGWAQQHTTTQQQHTTTQQQHTTHQQQQQQQQHLKIPQNTKTPQIGVNTLKH